MEMSSLEKPAGLPALIGVTSRAERTSRALQVRFLELVEKVRQARPSSDVERDGFLDEIERISDATGIFDDSRLEALDAFLSRPGPDVVPEPERLATFERAVNEI